jgi:hypothetical protein
MDLEKIAEIYIRWYKKKVGIECPDTITVVCGQMQEHPAIKNRLTKDSVGNGNTAKFIHYLKPEFKILEDIKEMDPNLYRFTENSNFDNSPERVASLAQEEIKKALNKKFDDLPDFNAHIKKISKEREQIIINTIKKETVKEFVERYKQEEQLMNSSVL